MCSRDEEEEPSFFGWGGDTHLLTHGGERERREERRVGGPCGVTVRSAQCPVQSRDSPPLSLSLCAQWVRGARRAAAHSGENPACASGKRRPPFIPPHFYRYARLCVCVCVACQCLRALPSVLTLLSLFFFLSFSFSFFFFLVILSASYCHLSSTTTGPGSPQPRSWRRLKSAARSAFFIFQPLSE